MHGSSKELGYPPAVVTKEEMRRLRSELKAAAVFEHRELAGWIKLALMLCLTALCYASIVHGPTWTWLLVPLGALAATTATLLGHEGSHSSFSASSRHNQVLSYVTLPLFAGISALYWKNKHNNLHHGHPNVVGQDPDIELWPAAMSHADYERAGPAQRWFQRHVQGYVFWPAATLLPTVMRGPSYSYLWRQLRTRPSSAALLDAVCLVGHYALWVVVPALLVGPLLACALYLSIWAVVGVLLALIFSPAHLGLPLYVDQHHSWRHQLETTRNFRIPRLLSYFYVGLDYQIEHHIFPQIGHANLPRASAIMKRWCGEVGLPYHEVGYGEAIASVTTFMHNAWRVQSERVGASAASATRGEPDERATPSSAGAARLTALGSVGTSLGG
jgi:fatty acid desaturase